MRAAMPRRGAARGMRKRAPAICRGYACARRRNAERRDVARRSAPPRAMGCLLLYAEGRRGRGRAAHASVGASNACVTNSATSNPIPPDAGRSPHRGALPLSADPRLRPIQPDGVLREPRSIPLS